MKRLLLALLLVWSTGALAEDEVAVNEVITDSSELPSCQDQRVLEQVKAMLNEYNKEHPVNSIYEKRQRALQLKYTKEYEEEPVAGYTSKKDENIANKLLMTKINQGLDDEQIRLCKSTQSNDHFRPIYLMMYFDHENLLQLHILNFLNNSNEELKTIIE